jgi:hypothetical protein
MSIAFFKNQTLPHELACQIKPAAELGSGPTIMRLSSRVKELKLALRDGLSLHAIHEWGLPSGQRGREVVLSFLTHPSLRILWVYSDSEVAVYPPAWQALGVDLNNIFFIQGEEPLQQIKPVFLHKWFNVIVLDDPKKLSSADLAFLHKQVTSQEQAIFVLRPYRLTCTKGNIWAKTRLNCWFDPNLNQFSLQTVKNTRVLNVTFSERGLYG